MTSTLILGAGFGGITVATELRRLAPEGHEIVLVDRGERFSMGLRKLWELVEIGTIADGSRPRELLGERGIRFIREAVGEIDPASRAATVGGERIEADHLVIGLGAETRPDLVPGLEQHGFDAWSAGEIPRLKRALDGLEGGRIAIVIAGAPYKCPPAPYELAMLLDEWLRELGLRERTELSVSTMQPILLPNAGPEGSAWVAGQLDARGIAHATKREVVAVEEGLVRFSEGELELDLLIAVSPHRPPRMIDESGLGGEGGWVGVDPGTLGTGHPGVYAIGDVTRIELANGLPMPKAGVIAEGEGARVAAAIAAEVRGDPEPDPFDGSGYCFIETGRGEASLVEGRFFAEPEPSVDLTEPSAVNAQAKREFEAERLERWFPA